MNILVINSGSTSFKYSFFDENFSLIKKDKFNLDPQDGQDKFNELFKKTLNEIQEPVGAVGHRVVHGGEDFLEATEVNQEILEKLSQLNKIAPLHNPYNLLGIKASFNSLPDVPNVAVFDTAFFRDLPKESQAYALPLEYFEKGIRRFGFHGTSHKYVALEAAKKLNKSLMNCNLITIHLGGGCSATAIKQGKPIDTSMGFTPLEGLVMGTRTGNIDPGILVHLLREENLSVEELNNLLNNESGIKGLTGGLVDFRDVLEAKAKGDEKAQFAFDVFVRSVKKYIGAYLALLERIDALVFTGAIGSGRKETREAILKDFSLLKNIPTFAIPTNEELQIAQEVKQLITK